MSGEQRTGREYLRVSMDRSGRARSIGEQHDDNAKAASSRGVALGRPYEDVSVSASRYSKKVRDGFDELLDDLRSGRFGADELWLWESSRGSRRVGEWVALLDALEAAHVLVFVTTHARAYDPTNARDRRSLLEDAVDSEYESAKVSARALRAAASNAAAGKPHGRTPFGYRRVYDPQTRKLVAQEPHPDEAPIVRELFDRLAGGGTLIGIARDFESRGVVNDKGVPFSAQHLPAIAQNPTYAGLRVWSPEARKGGRRIVRRGEGTWVEATWERLVDRQQWEMVYGILTNPERVTTRPGGARHLLSMIAGCAVCGGPLAVTLRRTHPEYVCKDKGCVRVRQNELDDFATGAIAAYLSRPDIFDDLERSRQDGNALNEVREKLASTRAERDSLYSLVKAQKLSMVALAELEPGLIETITGLEQRERDLTTPPTLRGLITPGEKVREQWEAASVDARRAIVRELFRPGMLGTLQVRRRPEGQRNVHVPVRERISLLTARHGMPEQETANVLSLVGV